MRQVRVDDYAYGVWFDVIEVNSDVVIVDNHLFDRVDVFSIDDNMKFRNIEIDDDLLTQTYYSNLE